VFLTSKELALLNEISELCGNVVNGDGQARRLISVSELQRLNKEKGEVLIMHARQYPVITEMADISMYKMYGCHESVDFAVQTGGNVKSFSLENMLFAIKELKAVAPFPSEKHKASQAVAIYTQEMEKVFGAPKPKRPSRFFLDDDDKKEEKKVTESVYEKEEKENKKKECEKRAWARIAELLGETYANFFFEKKLYEVAQRGSFDDDDMF